jgi:hypothetical protein
VQHHADDAQHARDRAGQAGQPQGVVDRRRLQSFPDLQVRPPNLAADDRVAILEASLTGTNTGPLSLGETDRLVLGTQAETLPATGRSMDIRGAVVLEVADGLVVAERHYWPDVDPLTQLGLIG